MTFVRCSFLNVIHFTLFYLYNYESDSISKLPIVIEKYKMEIMAYKQHLFFNIISIQIYTLVPPFHKSLETCGLKFFWLLSEPRAHCSFNCIIVRKAFSRKRTSPPNYGCLTWQEMFTVHGQHFFVDILCFHSLPTKNAQRHAALSWFMYSGAPPTCNSCYVCTVMRIPFVVRHNKTRYCCYLAVTVSRT